MPFLAIVYVRDADQARRVKERFSSGDCGRIVGLYQLPKKGIPTCTGTCDATDRKLNGWGRHPKYGHTTHACGRRHRDWRRRIRTALLDTVGINLLKRSETPAMFQNPGGWGK